ncbi:hypothetical protein [Hansschlegelia zhihuaiae]|uniref:Uncharacterized protein n=1 Tax=Hansschlegelia zhihuaiae TaxID=405005 RepID=A0A4Q0MAN9_9HYPH|nr:hypothetical protein [Hansschlegelia zhihuaiae]RXF70338.1 hypothetical protein EK403_17455 [Hansschlegelia zhihuaiae]
MTAPFRNRLAVMACVMTPLCASAAETGGCGKFAWPIDADKALLAAAEQIESGAALETKTPKAVRIVMVDAAKAGFEVPPSRPPAPDAPGGVLRFEAEAGVYQFTMTDRVWIDVVQNGKALEEAGFSGVLDCDGARKSVRFELDDGPVTVQLSGSPARTTAIAITRSPKDAPMGAAR